MADYSQNIIKKYNYWTVYLHSNQCYLGRCIIWCDRKDSHDLTDATAEEITEFSQIIKDIKIAIEKSFNPDWINYSFLGNTDKHLHCIMVPRYRNSKEFLGQTFEDSRYNKGLNWLEDKSFVTSQKLIQAIKKKIQENLG